MIDKPPEVIYLIPDDNGYVWCEDPAPGVDMEEEDAVVYMRVDAFVEQARDLIEGQTIRTEMDNFDAGYNTALNDIENAIRNKFK